MIKFSESVESKLIKEVRLSIRLADKMEVSLVSLDVGHFLISDNNRILDSSSHSSKPFKAASTLLRISRGEITREIRDVIGKALALGVDTLNVEDEALGQAIAHEYDLEVKYIQPLRASQYVRNHYYSFAKRGLKERDIGRIRQFKWDTSILLLKEQLRRASEKKDLLVIQGIESLDELNRTINLLVSRLREWNGLTFPELNRQIPDHLQLARIISKFKSKESITSEKLVEELKLPESKSKKIAKLAKGSVGATLDEVNVAPIIELADTIIALFREQKNTEDYLEKSMKQIAPNITRLIGPQISARLISHAGSLEKLARMPSSTLQILGAEKALFRSKKTGSRPPKHGIIYQVIHVHGAKRWQRGKISRIVAGKLSIAARIDAYSGEDYGDSIEKDIIKKIENIKKRFSKAPMKKMDRRPSDRRDRDQRSFSDRRSRPQRDYGDRRGSSSSSGNQRGESRGYRDRRGSSSSYGDRRGSSSSSGNQRGESRGSRGRNRSKSNYKPRRGE
ncbi:MAG: hypothetical protein ACTSUV_02700 [Candidatus Ranarchaeia archaeon]